MDHSDRQKTLNLQVPESVVIIGCGGTGVWTTIGLALAGTKRFLLIDNDSLDPTNLNRLPYSSEWIGRSKSWCLMMFLTTLGVSVGHCNVKFEKSFHDSLGDQWSILVDCTDDPKAQKEIYSFCKKYKKFYLRVGCDHESITVSESIPSGAFMGDIKKGYAQPSWVYPPMLAGAEAVKYLCKLRGLK